jgi:hypothetical protein
MHASCGLSPTASLEALALIESKADPKPGAVREERKRIKKATAKLAKANGPKE